MSKQDFQVHNVRDSAVLTNSYVAGTIVENQALNNQLIIDVDFTIGSLTSVEIKVEYADEVMYDLDYDGQTANFTAGKNLTGSNTKDTAIIVSDTDSGASGTLVLKAVRTFSEGGQQDVPVILNSFEDNETITDNNSTAGTAVVNGSLSVSDYPFHQDSNQSPSGGTTTLTLNEFTFASTGKPQISIPIKCGAIRISAKGTGTVTGSLLRLVAKTGIV